MGVPDARSAVLFLLEWQAARQVRLAFGPCAGRYVARISAATLRFADKNYQHHFECGLLNGIGSAKRKIGILDHVPSVSPDNDYTHAHAGDMTVPVHCPYRLEHILMNDQYKGTKMDQDQIQRFASDAGLLNHPEDARKDEVK